MTFSQERQSVRAAGVGDQRRGWQDGADVDGRGGELFCDRRRDLQRFA